jgi:hypothetical protein
VKLEVGSHDREMIAIFNTYSVGVGLLSFWFSMKGKY